MTESTLRIKELNAIYPERRNKEKTRVVDSQDIEARVYSKDPPLTRSEQACLAAIAVDYSDEVRFIADISIVLDRLSELDRAIFEMRQEGYTQAEIAVILGKARITIIRRLAWMLRELKKYFSK
jgi:DNA-directed RNA polymerase specialized sigma24 family protein